VQGLAALFVEQAAFGQHDEVESFGDAGIKLDAAVGQGLDRRDAGLATRAQPRHAGAAQPGLLQRLLQRRVAEHGAEHGHAQLAGAQPDFGASRADLADADLVHRLGLRLRPGTEPAQPLDRAQAERQRAAVLARLSVNRQRVVDLDLRVRQRIGTGAGKGQADRSGADDSDLQTRIHGPALLCRPARPWPMR
jgi:hypothetical protein